jgi:hypothetical protein
MDGLPPRQAKPPLCLSTTGAARRADCVATIASASLGDHEAIEMNETKMHEQKIEPRSLVQRMREPGGCSPGLTL